MAELVSKASICNDALVLLGQPRLIADAEAVQEYAAAATVIGAYEGKLEYLLRTHPWNFARVRVALNAHPTAPAFGFAYRYETPADCLRVWKLDEVRHGNDPVYSYEGGFVLTDEAAPLNLLYIRTVSDPQEFDSDFRLALAHEIAEACALSVLGSNEAVADFNKRMKEQGADARFINPQENRPKPRDLFDGTWLPGRRTG